MEVKRRVLELIGGGAAGAGYQEVGDTLLSLKIEFCEQHLALAQVSSRDPQFGHRNYTSIFNSSIQIVLLMIL